MRKVLMTAKTLEPIEYKRTPRLLRAIPISEWPVSERQRFISSLAHQRSSSEEVGASPTHRRNLRSSYGCSLRWLEQNNLLNWNLSPADRWPSAVLVQYIIWLLENYAHATVVHRLRYLKAAVSLLDPSADLRRFAGAIKHQGKPIPQSRDELVTTNELIALSEDLRAEGKAAIVEDAHVRSYALRDGLLLGLIALLFPRPKELLLLTIGRPKSHLYWSGHEWRIRLSASETKTHIAWNKPFPPEFVDDLTFYLGRSRPILQVKNPASDALWLLNGGRKMGEKSLDRMVRDRVFAKYKKIFSPHQGRKAGTTFLAEHAPEMIDDASTIMGNLPLVRDAHYNAASVSSAVNRVNECIEKMLYEK